MCGRFEQSRTRRYYAQALGADTSDAIQWTGGDHIASYNVAPGLCPWMIMLRNHKVEFIGKTWGYVQRGLRREKPWINACRKREALLDGLYS